MNYKQLPGRCSKCHKWDKGVKRVRTKNLRENGKEGSGSFSLLHSMQKNTDRLVWLSSDTGIALNSLLDSGSDTIYWLYILTFIVMPILLISLLLLLLLLSLLQTCDSSHLASAWIRYEPETLALRKRPVYEKKGVKDHCTGGREKAFMLEMLLMWQMYRRCLACITSYCWDLTSWLHLHPELRNNVCPSSSSSHALMFLTWLRDFIAKDLRSRAWQCLKGVQKRDSPNMGGPGCMYVWHKRLVNWKKV